MSEDRRIMAMDAVVGIADAVRWMEEIRKEVPLDLASRLADYEPCVVGACARMADQTRTLLVSRGVSPDLANEAADKVLIAGMVALELMRRGHNKAWEDFFLPETESKGDQNGK